MGFSGDLLPRARTSIRVLRTPLSIRNDRTERARDNETRRALLDDMELLPAYASNCSRRVATPFIWATIARSPSLAWLGSLLTPGLNTTRIALPALIFSPLGGSEAVCLGFGVALALGAVGGGGSGAGMAFATTSGGSGGADSIGFVATGARAGLDFRFTTGFDFGARRGGGGAMATIVGALIAGIDFAGATIDGKFERLMGLVILGERTLGRLSFDPDVRAMRPVLAPSGLI